MKLPISFGNRLFLRMLIPGTILALGLFPGIAEILPLLNVDLSSAILFSTIVIGAGWFITLIDLPIYMLLEGRRFWPRWLFRWRVQAKQKWVVTTLEKAKRLSEKNDRAGAVELELRAYQFPIGEGRYPPTSGLPTAVMPTELGNVIYGYETYPTVKYGADGIFFWNRLWLLLDDNLRKTIDEQQSFADSAVYASFASALNAVLFLAYGILENGFDIELLSENHSIEAFIVGIAFVVISFVFYKSAVVVHDQFGNLIKSMFDTHIDKLPIEAALIAIGTRVGYRLDPYSIIEKRRAVWRYLQWHKYRRTPKDTNVNIEDASSSD